MFDDAFEHEVWQEQGIGCTDEAEAEMNAMPLEKVHGGQREKRQHRQRQRAHEAEAGWRLVLVVDFWHPNAL